MKKYENFILPFLLFFFVISSYGQLPTFNFTLTATNETCNGNGKLDFQVTGTNPAAQIIYTVYLLPQTTNPYRILSANTLTGLSAGTYRVIAKQTLGTQENTQQRDAVILDRRTQLEFNMAGSDASACSNNGIITVSVTSGNPVGYEIITGPITRPIQTSNIFTNLVAGSYLIGVHDACGNAVSRSHTLVTPAFISNGISISPVQFPERELPSCNLITVGHQLQILNQYYVAYPLVFKYTVRPLGGGAPIVVTNTITGNSGRHPGGSIPTTGSFTVNIPYYVGAYNYDLEVTDACGKTYSRTNNIVDRKMTASLSYKNAACGKKILTTSAINHKFPITIQFLAAPAGFNPALFNSGHPTFSIFPEYGSETNPVPEGTYNVRITDACGRSDTSEVTVVNQSHATVNGGNSCEGGAFIEGKVPGSRIVSVKIMSAPVGFPFSLPYNAQAFINAEGEVKIFGFLIPGNYILEIKDDCNNTYTEPANVPNLASPNYNVSYMGGCQPGFGSVYIARSPAANLQSIVFNFGPSNYAPGFPHNVSSNIRGNYFMMDSLPMGTYSVTITDVCNVSQTIPIIVKEYIGNTTINITERCSSFDMYLAHTNNNSLTNIGYWLQKKNEITGLWEHPLTHVVYDGTSIPHINNAISLTNNSLNVNLGIGGFYRVLTASSLFSSVNSTNTFCLHVLREFQTGARPVINQALSFSCSGNLSDVFIDATGSSVLNYKIIEKNYQPFQVDNQNNPLFTDLPTGIYLFQVEDLCRNRTTILHDLSAPFVFTISPTLCNGTNSTLSVPNFSYLQYEWYKQGQESTILSNTSTLSFNPLNLNAHSGIYHVKIIYPSDANSCLNQTLNYTIDAGIPPNAGDGNTIGLCSIPTSINLFNYLIGTYDLNGEWQQITPGGTLIANMWNLSGITGGSYQFKYVVKGFCGVKDEALVTLNFINVLSPPILSTVAPVCIGEPVNISVTNLNLLYTYSWTGPNGFTTTGYNPSFPNATAAMSGTYSVTAYLGSCPSQPTRIQLVVKPSPEFHFENESNSICAGQNIKLSVVGDNFNENSALLTWYFEGTEMIGFTDAEIEIDQPGIYKVIANYDGCSSQKETRIEVNNDVFLVGTKVGCENELYMLSAFAINNSFDESTAIYEWTGPNGFTSNVQSVDVTGLESGEYKILITNESGCKSEAKIYVKKGFCKIPKGVSPNGDTSNDTWDLTGLDIHKVKIFNRYGTEVYELNDYLDQWHGQAKNGNLLPTATYYYYIKFRNGEEKTGWVYLNREVH